MNNIYKLISAGDSNSFTLNKMKSVKILDM